MSEETGKEQTQNDSDINHTIFFEKKTIIKKNGQNNDFLKETNR